MTLSAKRAALLALICLGVEFGSARTCRRNRTRCADCGCGAIYVTGCSSCPPADALLGELSQMQMYSPSLFTSITGNSIGWRDHFALPTAVRRQQQYVETLGLSSAFTPQVVVRRA